MIQRFQFKLNGKPTTLNVDGDRMLLWVLRTDQGLTGTKYGCGEGYCGSCTVLMENEAVRSCQTPFKDVQGKSVVTVEGLAKNGKLHAIQRAFMEHDAFQCGYCTSGMIMNACSVLNKNPRATLPDIVEGMDNNLCRGGAHVRILDAVQTAAKEMKGGI